MISVITPVHNSPELSAAYVHAVRGCEVVIVDNASQKGDALVWERAARDLDGRYIRNDTNRWYATACNQGYAQSTGDVIIFANNDIMKRGEWREQAEKMDAGALYGPSLGIRVLAGQPLLYIDAWWIGARRETWEALKLPSSDWARGTSGPWDGDAFQGMYWDDVDRCFRAARAGMALRALPLPLVHLSNYTSAQTPGAYANTDSHGGNGKHRDIVESRVRAWRESTHAEL
jgi:glycosyltransferase involved in cell wall biosynthesis